ncbi:MAG TPA: GNAT family N-acetyltransferase, partial [Parachlamydiaceae bacterium]|nr:GNAT family N-acetyltransferase [Parachlamydiaceae bacterium]
SQDESNRLVKLMSAHIERCGWGFWATSLIQTGEFIGFIGLEDVSFKASFNQLTPTVEIGWRLGFNHWGKGYATEGALAALRYGYKALNLEEIVSFTTVTNQRSRHVMEKIGMHHDPKDDFDHPNFTQDHPLKRHVLYRLEKSKWIYHDTGIIKELRL